MQSEATPQSPNSNPSPVEQAPLPPTGIPLRAKDISASLKDADTALDFIKNNIRTPAPQALDPQQVVKEVEAKVTTPPVVEPKVEEKTVAVGQKNPVEVVSENIEPEFNDKEENIKAMRKRAAEVKAALKEKEAALLAAQETLKKYETGEAIPEPLKKAQERIKQLEPYEQVIALKVSPAYKEKFVKPVEEIRTRLQEIAADYELPKELMDKALNIGNRRELNEFLSHHFDDIGALEVKELVGKARDITKEAIEAEKLPTQAIAALEEDYKNIQAAKRATAINSIIASNNDGWIESLQDIRKEGKILELIEDPNDPEFNEKIVTPVMTAAAREHGKIIKMLAENGLEKLPKDLAYALAKQTLLAHASALSIESRHLADARAEELRRNAQRDTRYGRPAIGSSGGGAGNAGEVRQSTEVTPAKAAEQILNKVMGNKLR